MSAGVEAKPLRGRTAVVTGGANGIGRAVAHALAKRGADICVVDIDASAGPTVEADAELQGVRGRFMTADVSDPAQVGNIARAAVATFEHVDILVNNAAAFGPRKAFVDLSWEEWTRVVSVNLDGPFHCAKAFVPHMIERRFGRIINVSSGLGVIGGRRSAPYSASKGGLIALTKCLALELAEFGITANVVIPGLTDTNQPRQGQSEAEIQELISRIPMKRLADPSEVAAFLVQFVGPESGYVTGQTLYINGGWLMP